MKIIRRIRGQWMLLRAALYLYKQGEPWDLPRSITDEQRHLLRTISTLLDLKDGWSKL